MSPTIAVFGAGTGLGTAVARRFGKEGYSVALVARRKEPLDALARELAAEGIEAAGFPADLSDPSRVPELIAAITERFGRIDVVEYAPIGVEIPFLPAAEVTAAGLRPLLDLLLYTPVEIVRAVLPQLRAAGSGAILLAQGGSAIQAPPGMSGIGPVMAATRHWIHTLHAELAPAGIYVGTLTIAAGIRGTRSLEAAVASNPEFGAFPTIEAADLAEQYWEMFSKRDEPERIYPPQEEWSPVLTGGE